MKKFILDDKYSMIRMILGIVIGIVCGITFPMLKENVAASKDIVIFFGDILILLGDLFINALKGIAPLLVLILITTSLTKKQGGDSSIKETIILFVLSTFIAGLVGIVFASVFPVKLSFDGISGLKEAAPAGIGEVLSNLLLQIVMNPIDALVQGNYLSLLFWASLLGFGLRQANENSKNFLDDLANGIMHIVQMIIAFAPIGVIGLIYKPIVESGIDELLKYTQLIVILVVSMLVALLVVFPIIIFVLLRQNPYPLIWYCIKNSAINAFLTRSSAANIPINMECCKKLNLNKQTYSVSIPLGSTVNMAGAAITISVMTLACCYTLKIDVPFYMAIALALIATVSAAGASGVTAGSLLLIPMACGLFGIDNSIAMQVVAIGIVIGVIQDSCETALNSSGDLLFTAVAEFYSKRKRGIKFNLKEIIKDAS